MNPALQAERRPSPILPRYHGIVVPLELAIPLATAGDRPHCRALEQKNCQAIVAALAEAERPFDTSNNRQRAIDNVYSQLRQTDWFTE